MNALLQTRPSAQAQARPDQTAVVWKNTGTSYGELERWSNRLAQFLVTAGCRRGDRIGLLMPKTPAAIIGILGTLKAGAAYVPLDPSDPGARLARTLESADCRWILAAGRVGQRLDEALAAARLKRKPLIGWLDDGAAPDADLQVLFTRPDLDAFLDSAPAVHIGAQDLAQILFTSGSTGTPKGVMITHASILHLISWAERYFGTVRSDRIAQQAPLRFDLSTMDVFGALSSGASLWLVPPELSVLPTKLADFVRDSELTQWLLVPSLLNLMAKFDVVRHGDFPALRRIMFAGEVLPTPTLIYWMSRLPHVQFTNLYGPTETTICSSYYSVPQCPADECAPIPIGTACEGEELLVLDERGQPAVDGEVGELCIGGPGLSPGYWNAPERTRSAFISLGNGTHATKRLYKTGDRARRGADGLYYFCGRADMQIKSRGYRIELGEIEAALHTLPELRESAVVAIDSGGFEGSLICCAYAPVADAGMSPQNLRRRLAGLVPHFMLPAHWQQYEVLPKNANGKLDRFRLRREFSESLALQDDSTAADLSQSAEGLRPGPRRSGSERGLSIE
ncbi:MAG: amino acid adenylation domain-containing protein [Woeseiaceae bacterium]